MTKGNAEPLAVTARLLAEKATEWGEPYLLLSIGLADPLGSVRHYVLFHSLSRGASSGDVVLDAALSGVNKQWPVAGYGIRLPQLLPQLRVRIVRIARTWPIGLVDASGVRRRPRDRHQLPRRSHSHVKQGHGEVRPRLARREVGFVEQC